MTTCDPVIDGEVVFWNSWHITASWSEAMGPSLGLLLRSEGFLPT